MTHLPPAPQRTSGTPPGRLGLVLNPKALRNATSPKKTEQLLSAFEELGETVLIGDGDGLTARLESWRLDGLDLLAISGGDGTYQRVVDEMLAIWGEQSLPRILFLLGGTAGIAAKETGSTDPLETIAALRQAKLDNRPIATAPLRMLEVGGRFTLSFGLGAFRKLAEAYVTYGRQIALSHSLLGARFLTSHLARGPFAREALQPCPHRIRMDGREFPSGHFVGLYASPLQRIALFRPLEGMDCPANEFKVVGIRESDSYRFIRSLWQILNSNGEDLPEALMLCGTQTIEIEPDGDSVDYVADGEFYGEPGPLSVSLGPELNIVRLNA